MLSRSIRVVKNLNKNVLQNTLKSSTRYYSTSSINLSQSSLQNNKSSNSIFKQSTNQIFQSNINNKINYRFYSTKNVVVNVPTMGDSISEGTVVAWNKNIGDSVKIDDVICSIETDKVTIEINATMNGKLTELFVKEGDNVSVGAPLYKIEEGAAGSAPAPKAEAPKQETPKPSTPKADAPKVEAPKAEAPKQETPKPSPKPAVEAIPLGGEKRVKMTRIRQRTAQRLKDSQNTAAMLTTFNEVDMSALISLRGKYKEEFAEKHGVKLGFMSAFVKASAIALKDQPIVNASVEESDIVYHDNINISVAVAAPRGLMVPVIRNCESLSFSGVEKELGRLSNLARNDQIAIEDSMGGTFTISNGGVYGSMFGTPIINPPQSAILGMHAVKDRPYVVNGKVEVRPIMYLALTYDHRIIDGREAVTFLKKIKDTIENPDRILLDI